MKSEFKKLKKKIILQVLLLVFAASVVGSFIQYFLIDGIFQDPFANWFISFCQHALRVDYVGAKSIYILLFRNQKTTLLLAGFLLLLIIIFYLSLSQLTKYFQEVSRGIDKLLLDSEKEIRLSPEMDFMELKLNSVKKALLKRAHDAKEAEQRKNDLVIYLAHDIRTPLTSIIGYLNLLNEASDMPTTQSEKYLKITLENSLRLEQLINEFFDITRFNLQTIQLHIDRIHLSFMLMQIADEFYPILEPKGKKIVVECPEDMTIEGDAEKLARVFQNILRNASVFSYENTNITIVVSQNIQFVTITFTNLGSEIPENQLEGIFEKFYRLDDSRSSQTGGAGLGLAIAKEIVCAHGGSISAASHNAETTFTVVLPSAITVIIKN